MAADFPMPGAPSGVGVYSNGVRLVPERNTFIPPDYEPHKHPERTRVLFEGEEFSGGFVVAQMPPERRWAVDKKGNCIPQSEFERKFLEYRRMWFHVASPEAKRGEGKVPESYKDQCEPIPHVKDYCAKRVDPADETRLCGVNYDPFATKGATSKKLWSNEANEGKGGFIEGEERMKVLVQTYNDESMKRSLLPHEIKEVEAYLGGRAPVDATQIPVAGATGVEVSAKLQLLTELRHQGRIGNAEYADEVAKFFAVAIDDEAKMKPGYRAFACGVIDHYIKQEAHVEKCFECQEAATAPEAETQEGDSG